MLSRAVQANANERRSFAAGEAGFRAGEEGAEMFGVVSGYVELRDGDQVVTAVGPEGTFGEMAIIEHAPRSLTAVTTQPTELAVIDRRHFLFLVSETRMFALDVMQSMAQRIHELNATH